ncbi:MAG TPA: cupin domain-containing protein [Thermomicrobiales bacterium]|nr:cupin domain-containing protein [Thermomicrobiales bacterium]
MIVYQPNVAVPDAALVDLGAPEGLGGKVLHGMPKISARIDFSKDGMTGGIFEATTGTVEIRFPFTEHATILEGEVTITDASGQSHTYRPGDSYLIEQDQVVLWDVQGERVRKSFFNITRK